MFWPGQSPDLNPIETIYRIIKQKLSGKMISNEYLLWKAIKSEWENISIEQSKKKKNDSTPKRIALLKKIPW